MPSAPASPSSGTPHHHACLLSDTTRCCSRPLSTPTVPTPCGGATRCLLVSGGCRVCLGSGGGAAETLRGYGGQVGAQECAGHRTGQLRPKYTLPKHKLTASQKKKGLRLAGWATATFESTGRENEVLYHSHAWVGQTTCMPVPWGYGWASSSTQRPMSTPTLQLRGFLGGGTGHVLCSDVNQDLHRRGTAHAGRTTGCIVAGCMWVSKGAGGTTQPQRSKL